MRVHRSLFLFSSCRGALPTCVFLCLLSLLACHPQRSHSQAGAGTPGSSSAPLRELEYEAVPGLGYCVEPGMVLRAKLTREGEGFRLQSTLLLESPPPGEPCEVISGSYPCAGLSREERVLEEKEVEEVLKTFREVQVIRDPADGCPAPTSTATSRPCPQEPGKTTTCYDFEDDIIESDDRCLYHQFRWDRLQLKEGRCSSTPHLRAQDVQRLVELLAKLHRRQQRREEA